MHARASSQRNRSSLLVAFLAAALCGGATATAAELAKAQPEAVGLSTERLARLDAGMQAQVDQGRKAGIVTLIARRGQVVQLKAYGMAERETDTKMTTEQMFRLYSMTKPVTSVALLMLYEEGKFQLGDPLERYIPAFKDLQVFAGADASGKMTLEAPHRKPTIHDVFRHTAGFTYGVFGATPVDKLYQSNGIDFGKLGSLAELVDKLAKVPLQYQPGEQWVYSVSHDVQAYLVERFSGMPFDQFCKERIFEPLGMKDAVFGVPKDYVARFTANHMRSPDGKLERIETREGVPPPGSQGSSFGGYARYTKIPFGGLSLSSTAMDYARFAQMLLNGGELDGVRLLSPKTVELMTSNNLPINIPQIGAAGPPDPNTPSTGYGLGVSVLLNPALAGNLGSKGTFGWAGAASTWVNVDPEEEMVTILLTQDMNFDSELAGLFQTLAYQAIVE